jgi:glutaconate CoA-transferase subunit A
MAQFMTLLKAVADLVQDGSTLAMEGFTHLVPFAAGHEIVRQKRRNLTLIRMTPDVLYDQLIGMGIARKLIFSWAGNPGVGSLHRFRDAVENDWPSPLEIEEHTHAAMANAYDAGAAGLPCAVFRGYFGSDLVKKNPNIKFIRCPFTGEELACVPSLRPDLAIIHAQQADRDGNVLIEGILGVQKQAVLAARSALVTVEKIVNTLEPAENSVVLPSWTITAVALVPGGAKPSYAHGYYSRDNAFYEDWDKISRDRDGYTRWMEEHVIQPPLNDFIRHPAPSSMRSEV